MVNDTIHRMNQSDSIYVSVELNIIRVFENWKVKTKKNYNLYMSIIKWI